MKEFLKKELYSFRAVAAILARWLLLAVPTGLVCGAVGTAFHPVSYTHLESTKGRNGVAACGDGHQTSQRAVERHGDVGLAVALPGKEQFLPA